MAVFQKFPILIIKRSFIYMEFENGRKYQKLTKTDKYPLVQKGKNCKQKGVRW